MRLPPLRVQRVGLDTERDTGLVRFVLVEEPRYELGRLSDRHHEDAGGHGVQSAGVPDLTRAEGAPDTRDHVVARRSPWLVDDQNAARGRRRHRSPEPDRAPLADGVVEHRLDRGTYLLGEAA